jgi:DNA-binding LacI/PurR family transcriptional regulator
VSGDGRGRVTISDIADRAGVSKGAVSYALNGRPGVSDATRERVLAIARELGWYPNRAARALSGAGAQACGFVLARPAHIIALEPFFMEFIAGVESELALRSVALMLQLVEDVGQEIEVYRRWFGERRVDGVLVMDLRLEDPRIEALEALGLPAVVVGGPLPGTPLPSVWHDERTTMVETVRYLAALGHDRVGHLTGPGEFAHTAMRSAAFDDAVRDLGLRAVVAETDYTPEAGARATRRLLSSPEPPTALVFDSDLLAVAGLGAVQQMGLAVPEDVSLVAWDDSLICRVVHPPLTAVSRDIVEYGIAAGRHLLAVIDGEVPGDRETPRGEVTVRGSTQRRAPAISRAAVDT